MPRGAGASGYAGNDDGKSVRVWDVPIGQIYVISEINPGVRGGNIIIGHREEINGVCFALFEGQGVSVGICWNVVI